MDYDNLSDAELDALVVQKVSQPKAQTSSKSFDDLSDEELDALVLQKFEVEAEVKPESRKVEAALQAFGNQGAQDYLPQLQALTEGVTDPIFNAFKSDEEKRIDQEFNVQDETYTQRRDRNIERANSLEEQHPAISTTAAIAGGIAGTVALGAGAGSVATKLATKFPSKFASAFQKLETLQKSKSFADKLKLAGLAGATTGAIRNPGDTEGEVNLLQLEDRAKNIATDAATGVVFQGGIAGLGKVGSTVKNAASDLGTYANEKALKASGAMLKDFRKAFGKKSIDRLGQSAINEGIIEVGDDIAAIAQKATLKKQEIGEAIGDIYRNADIDLGVNGLKNQGFDFGKFIKEIQDDVAVKYKGKAGGSEVVARVNKTLEEISDNPDLSLSKLKEIRQSLDELIDHSKRNQDLKSVQSEYLAIRNKIQDNVKDSLAKLDKAKGTSYSESFLKENRRYANVAKLEEMATDKVAREAANASFGMRERLAGGTGAVVGGSVGAMLGGPMGAAVGAFAGNKLGAITTKAARQYGTPYVAITANKIARALEKNPRLLGKFSKTLIDASEVSPVKFVAQVNALMSEPEFKKQLIQLRPAASNEETSKTKISMMMR